MPDIPVASATAQRDPVGVGGVIPVPSRPVLIKVQPIQVVGLVPLHDCTVTICRQLPDLDCCKRRLVFGGSGIESESNAPPGYEVDYNSFLIDLAIYAPNIAATVVSIVLQKCTGVDTWTTVTTLNNNTYGKYYPLGGFTNHPTYVGYLINWARVLALRGAGIYRIRFNTQMRTKVGCLVSDEFDLRVFSCRVAHGTVKFEAILKGQIGSATVQGKVYDLCNMSVEFVGGTRNGGWYDSVRLPGFFGYEKIKEYLEVILEYQTGLQERVKDEAIQSFSFMSNYFKKELHDRLKIYGLMSDKLLVSDYNINNSDYNINRLHIIKAGPYEPVYQDKLRRRISKVTVEFSAGVQNIIKSLCCPTK